MREVRSSDFGERARIRMFFPRKGSQFTPPHYSVDFYWKDYCPMVFRYIFNLLRFYLVMACVFLSSHLIFESWMIVGSILKFLFLSSFTLAISVLLAWF